MTTNPVDARVMYLVGLFEGEGCASIGREKRLDSRVGYQYVTHLTLVMTDIEPINACLDYFGSVLHIRKWDEKTNMRPAYVWRVSGRNAGKVAKVLIPHILTPRKRGALQCVIDYAVTIQDSSKALSPEIWQKRADLHQKCKLFNAKGINANNRSEEALVAIEAYETDTAQMNLWA